MKLTLKHTIAAILLMWSFAAPVAAGPLEDGYTAYTRGDFATAMRLMRPLADQGNITAQIVVGFVPNTNSDNFGWLPCFFVAPATGDCGEQPRRAAGMSDEAVRAGADHGVAAF